MTSVRLDSTDRIRALAHQLWEQEGCPNGRADIHWFLAEELVREEQRSKPQKKARTPRKKVVSDKH
jgi:hypothetical protein